jgi:hypothetical protein
MSILGNFISSIAPITQTVIGADTLTIGNGMAIIGTFNEARHLRDYENGGFERDAIIEFVVGTTTFEAAYTDNANAYLGKKATARSITWRVASIRRGDFFVTLGLVSTNKAG